MIFDDASKEENYLIISGTNRIGSHTEKVARQYLEIMENKGIPARFLTLKNLNILTRNEEVKRIEEEYLIPAQKYIFIIPEYNGSFPGILKLLIDNSDIRNVWYYKKALLTGVATGRAGNLRGMDHLTGVLQYLRLTVHYNKLPISSVNKLMDEHGKLDPGTLEVINQQLDQYIKF